MHCIIKTHRQNTWDDGVAPSVKREICGSKFSHLARQSFSFLDDSTFSIIPSTPWPESSLLNVLILIPVCMVWTAYVRNIKLINRLSILLGYKNKGCHWNWHLFLCTKGYQAGLSEENVRTIFPIFSCVLSCVLGVNDDHIRNELACVWLYIRGECTKGSLV